MSEHKYLYNRKCIVQLSKNANLIEQQAQTVSRNSPNGQSNYHCSKNIVKAFYLPEQFVFDTLSGKQDLVIESYTDVLAFAQKSLKAYTGPASNRIRKIWQDYSRYHLLKYHIPLPEYYSPQQISRVTLMTHLQENNPLSDELVNELLKCKEITEIKEVQGVYAAIFVKVIFSPVSDKISI